MPRAYMKEPVKHRLRRLAYETLLRIIRPDQWLFMMTTYHYEWDVYLQNAMHLGMFQLDTTEFPRIGKVHVSPHVLKLGDTGRIWVGNYPYSFATPHHVKGWPLGVRPSFRTIRAVKKLEKELRRTTDVY